MIIDQLVLEVTRRCNMRCSHCLRGDAQTIDMSRKVLDRVFSQVSRVSSLTVSGGEPSMAVPVIKDMIDAIRRHNVEVGSFFVVTNGKTSPEVAKRFAYTLMDLYALCDSWEDGCGGLTVSGDAWHEEVDIPSIYGGLSFFLKDTRHGPTSVDGVINTGRAAQFSLGIRKPSTIAKWEVEEWDGEIGVQETVYVSAQGNVISDCDQSYETIDGESFGNVLTEDLQTIIKQNTVAEDVS